jgi:hypothetical protein
MTGSDPDAPPADSIPDDPEERQAFAEQLASRADDDPDSVTHGDLATVVALLSTDDPATRVAAAEVLQHLHDRPSLFEPFVEDLIAAVRPYPNDVDGIPAPIEWMGSAAIRAELYLADSLARVARERPDIFVPHAAALVELLRSDRNVPRYLLFVVGYAAATDGDVAPREWLVAELCDLLDRGHGSGYPSWAAATLQALGASEALLEIREAYPDESADDATREAFDDAIAALEADSGHDDGHNTDA